MSAAKPRDLFLSISKMFPPTGVYRQVSKPAQSRRASVGSTPQAGNGPWGRAGVEEVGAQEDGIAKGDEETPGRGRSHRLTAVGEGAVGDRVAGPDCAQRVWGSRSAARMSSVLFTTDHFS